MVAPLFQRNLKPLVEAALDRSPVTLITGARQTGKTILAKQIAEERGYKYVTFDLDEPLLAAKNNPHGFIAGLAKPIVLDEVQRVPELFLAIKKDVDEERTPGNYLLTGSANPLLLPRLGDSLAGRMEILTMMPLSQGELSGHVEHFLERAFTHQQLEPPAYLPKADLYKKIITGGYPTVQASDLAGRVAWFSSYISAILQRDVRDLANIERALELPNILKYMATRVSGLHNTAELARVSKIPNATLHRYVSLLEILFLISFQPAWSSNLGKRLTKSPKLYFPDSGLLSFLLGISEERALSDPYLMGPIIESFVAGEIAKQLTWSKTYAKSYHFRSVTGIEVDIVLEDFERRIVGIEVKSSERVTTQDFQGLIELRKDNPDHFVQGFVVYTGKEVVPFDNNLTAIPISALWS